MLGKIEGGKRRGRQRMRWLDGITDQWFWGNDFDGYSMIWVNSGSWWWTWRPGVLQSIGSQRVRHNWATELNWTDLICSWWSIVTIMSLLFTLQLGKVIPFPQKTKHFVGVSLRTDWGLEPRSEQLHCVGLALCSVVARCHASSWRRGLRDGTNRNPWH